MSVRQDDRVRVALRDDRRPALGHIADAQVAAEEGRSIDFHPTVDEDAAAVRVKAPQQVAAVVVVVEDADRFPESLERIRRLHRKDGGDGGRFIGRAEIRKRAVGNHDGRGHDQERQVDDAERRRWPVEPDRGPAPRRLGRRTAGDGGKD